MSLINEALKRARQESRRREALAKGMPLAPPHRSGSHRSWLIAAVVAMAVALIVSLVTIARLAIHEPTTSASVDAIEILGDDGEKETSSPTDTSIEPIGATGTVPEPRGDAASLRTSAADAAQPPPSAEDRMSGPTQDSSSLSDTSASHPSSAEGEEGAVTTSPSSSGLANLPAEGVSLSSGTRNPGSADSRGDASAQPRIFVERALLPSGDTLELGGIAWSETGPYALLDERVVGLGESIMGHMVTRIAPQEVELEGSDGTILIRLK